nr:ABC transporter ATP-binding protein [Bacteroidota bacterium]
TDEALGVGDIRFQQKCYRKIREFKDRDKTIVLCSHSLSAVKDFCSQAIWLHEGKIREQGDPIYVTDCYNAFMTSNTAIDTQIETPDNEGPLISFGGNKALAAIYGEIKWQDLSSCESFGIGGCHIQFASIIDIELNKNISLLQGGEKVRVLLYLTTKQTLVTPAIHLLLNGQFGSTLFNINSHAYHQPVEFEIDKPTIVAIDFIFPKIGNGRYSFSFGVISIHESTEQHHHWVHDAMIIEVYNPDVKYRMGTALIIDEATVVSHTV